MLFIIALFVVVQSLSHVQLFVIPRTEAHQASLFFTISQSLLKLMSIESVMPSNHLILCHSFLLLPSIFPSTRVFSNGLSASAGQSIEALASASVLPMNSQDLFPLGLTGFISLQSKGLSKVFSDTTVRKFNSSLFIVAKIWKQYKCPLIDESDKEDVVYIYTPYGWNNMLKGRGYYAK